MKKPFYFPFILFSQFIIGQASGNVNYQNSQYDSNNVININFPSTSDILINVKGLANVTADTYMAVFSTSQTGKTTKEVNEIIDQRITQSLNEIKQKKWCRNFCRYDFVCSCL
ncbi:hypothetical protein [Flavobacterium sp.]|uniref:hypothetical protein n=1 Tax=Flavobacterium sp. TaxID=239 RepID=UPI002D97EA2E|nr:hypothetical protein [Flavobacterium sp.]